MPARQARHDWRERDRLAIVAMTLTLASVFAPLAFDPWPHRTALHRVRAEAGGGGARVRVCRAGPVR